MKRVLGFIIGIIGWLLSPLTWWNDIIINFPLAYLMAIPFRSISENSFTIAIVITYWLTNILGIILMRFGLSMGLKKKSISKKSLVIDLGISIVYSVAIIILLQLGVITTPKL